MNLPGKMNRGVLLVIIASMFICVGVVWCTRDSHGTRMTKAVFPSQPTPIITQSGPNGTWTIAYRIMKGTEAVVTQAVVPTVEYKLPPRVPLKLEYRFSPSNPRLHKFQPPPAIFNDGGLIRDGEFYSRTRRQTDGMGLSLIDTIHQPSPIDLK